MNKRNTLLNNLLGFSVYAEKEDGIFTIVINYRGENHVIRLNDLCQLWSGVEEFFNAMSLRGYQYEPTELVRQHILADVQCACSMINV